MDNQKYLNYYVEIMTGTMTDAVIRNISLQANARVTEEVIDEQSKTIEKLKNDLENVNSGKDGTIKGHLDTINSLNNQLSELNKMKGDYETVKHQVDHVNTFRSELVKERAEHLKTRKEYENTIKGLNEQIEYLQLTPAKRKKIDEEKNKVVEVIEQSSVLPIIDDLTKDGGSF
jgi:chromosome segregation ATPase